MTKPHQVFRSFACFVFFVVFWLCPVEAAFAMEPLTRVKLFDAHPRLDSVLIEGPVLVEPLGVILPSLRLEADGSQVLLRAPGSRGKRAGRARFQSLRIKSRSASVSQSVSEIAVTPGDGGKRRHYRGVLNVTASGGALRIVNEVDTRSYIASVVGSESLPDFPLEALKAQTVLACTTRVRGHGVVGDSTAVQAYLGSDYERPLVKKAVAAVYGELLGRHKKVYPRAVYYHSTCAGSTSDAREIFSGKPEKESERVLCTNCRQSPFFTEHSQVIKIEEIKSKLGFVPVKVLAADGAGRPLQVLVARNSGAGRQEKISGYQLWLKLGQNFGWGAVPGMRYKFREIPGNLVFLSSGAGHGVGLCQWGAAGLAGRGKNYKEILRVYFPDACLLSPQSCSLSGKGPGN